MGVIIVGALLFVLLQASLSIPEWNKSLPAEETKKVSAPDSAQLGMGLLGVRTERLESDFDVAEKKPGYFLLFEIISVHLLVVLIGAAYLARAKRRKT
jgi:hypothetical protein